MPSDLQDALWRLEGCTFDPTVFRRSGLVVTGSGFHGQARADIRELCSRVGLTYSGDLVNGHSTHLVLAPEGAAGIKLRKAAEWGIPCVRLAWLLDSVAAARVLPVQPYLHSNQHHPSDQTAAGQQQQRGASGEQAQGPGQQQPRRQQQATAASCQQLHRLARPSSVASNEPPVAAGAGAASCSPPARQRQQHDAYCGVHNASGEGVQQAQQRRAALAPVENQLSDQLRRMSISPEPPPEVQQQQQQQVPAGPQHPAAAAHWPEDSPPQQRSPSASPQGSLSLQGMVGAGSPDDAGSARPSEVVSAAQAGSDSWRQASRPPASQADTCMQQQHQSAGQPASYSPMCDSPACGQQQQAESPLPSGRSQPFSFSAALGHHSASDELGGGSPMAESPAASASPTTAGGSAGALGHSRLGVTPARAGDAVDEDGQEPVCTLPTPACIRDWSDDDSTIDASPTAAMCRPAQGATHDELGITQTPLEVRQAMAGPDDATQFVPPRQQQRDASEAMQQTPAAVRDWSDDETVASEPPGSLAIADSGSDADDVLLPHQQPVEQEQPLEPAAMGLQQQVEQQDQQQAAPPCQPLPQPKRLLQVSRPSAGQPAAASRAKAATAGWQSKQAERALATEVAKQEPAAALEADDDEPMPSPSGDWEPEAPGSISMSAGRSSSSLSPAGAVLQPPGVASASRSAGLPCARQQQQQQQQASISSAAGPAVGEHFVTSRRQGGGSRQPQRQQRSVRDWSDDDSSGDDFPTPTGHNRGPGGLTGLTQLDPASLIVARPKPSFASATWRGDEAGSQGGVVGMKFLQRPPRGNAVREHHGLANLKAVQFAEQVQVSAAGLILSTKDKKTAVRLQPGGLTEEEAEDEDFQADSSGGRRSSSSSASSSRCGGSQASAAQRRQQGQQQQQQQGPATEEPVLAEPQTFYRLPDGTWWLEYCRFYTAAQVEAAAAQAGKTVALPHGFDRECELLKAVGREYATISDVAGGVQIRRVKQGGTALRLRGGVANSSSRSYFWRLALDTINWRVLTDRPTADFVAIE